tara:strand:+ start:6708 stop:6998 length:291 start_codon:yes stop_codon:yes gene_type:complete
MRISIIYGVIASIVAAIAMYLDDRLLDAKKTKSIYFKNMMLVFCIVAGGIYLIGEKSFEQAIGNFDLGSVQQQGRGFGGYGYIGGKEEILTGMPNF